ncbi:MGMT family protein [Flavitalea sp.]|nr:MGMT family protein [Flavitalea sp.]
MATKTNKPAKKGANPVVRNVKAVPNQRLKPVDQKVETLPKKRKIPADQKIQAQDKKDTKPGRKKSKKSVDKTKQNKIPSNRDKTNENSSQEKLSVITPSGRKDQSFFQLVYEVARQIPKGRVTSYGAIAACLGTKLSARMVGWAMNGAHNIHPKIPAHRVVNRNGMLSGKNHFETPDKMKELLEKEGTAVVDDTVVNFKEKFWDPASEF